MRTRCLIAGLTLVSLLLAFPIAVRIDALAEDVRAKPAVPPDARDTPNPIPAAPKSIQQGEMLYQSQCAMCHGATGDGKGDLAIQLKMEVPDFTDKYVQDERTDGEWFWLITHGHKRMPADGERLPPEMRWHMVNYIRTFAPPLPEG